MQQYSPRPLAAGFVIVVLLLFIFITGATDRIDFFNRKPGAFAELPSPRLCIELHPPQTSPTSPITSFYGRWVQMNSLFVCHVRRHYHAFGPLTPFNGWVQAQTMTASSQWGIYTA